MDKVSLSNANRKANRNKNKTLDWLCQEILKLKKGKNEIEYLYLFEVVDNEIEVKPFGTTYPPELRYTGRQTIIIRINGGDRNQERKLILEGK